MAACKAPTTTKISTFCPKIQPCPLCSARRCIGGTWASQAAVLGGPRDPHPPPASQRANTSLFPGHRCPGHWGFISTGWKWEGRAGGCDVWISPALTIPTAGSILPGPVPAGSGVLAERGGCRRHTAPRCPSSPRKYLGSGEGFAPGALQAPLGWFCAAAE